MSELIPLIGVVGPTASGKTKLAVSLAFRFGGEIVSCDSMQVYRGMDVGTAKPTEQEMGGVPHHLLGVVDESDSFSVAKYVEMANEAIADIVSRSRIPIVTGGTGLYYDSLMGGIDFSLKTEDPAVRERLSHLAKRDGFEALYVRLCRLDPEAAKTIHLSNEKRILRALEMMEVSGQTVTELKRQSRQKGSPYRCLTVGLAFRSRQVLYDRINCRVDEMMESGLLDETRRLYEGGYSETASGAIGYKELFPFLTGEKSLDDCVAAVKQATRRYAKRQLTWFRRNETIKWLFVDETADFAELVEEAAELCESFLKEVQG